MRQVVMTCFDSNGSVVDTDKNVSNLFSELGIKRDIERSWRPSKLGVRVTLINGGRYDHKIHKIARKPA